MVLSVANTARNSHRRMLYPRPQCRKRRAIHRKTPASLASSVTTVIATTNNRMGATRSTSAARSAAGSVPVAAATAPAASRTAPMIAKRMNGV
jgi:hypothetical protein